jgi:hypothetical protein
MIWDEEAFTAANLEFCREGSTAYFKTPPTPMDEVAVGMVGEELQFFPARSSGHRRVLARLGLTS